MTQTPIADRSAKTRPWPNAPRPRLLQLGLLLCVIAVFLPVCRFDFLNFDDNVNVYKNYHITDFSLGNLIYFWTRLHENLYIPLTYTLWGGLAKLSALLPAADGVTLHPSLFHAMNLIVHGGSVLVLFQLLRLLFDDDWAAASGALLFALHPVQVETVAWVTGMKDALCGFFSLLALWQYLAYAKTSTVDLPWRHQRYARATLFLAAALLCKPGAVTIPLTAALLGYCLCPRKLRQLALELGPWLLLTLPVVIVTKFAQPAAHHTYLPALWQRFLIAGDAITFYLGKLLLPLTLGPDYGRTPQVVLANGWVYATGLFPYFLALCLGWRYRKPWALAAAGTFTTALLPVLGFVPFDFQDFSTVADRYLYVAMLGPALGLAWLTSRPQRTQAVRLLVITILLLFGTKSALQVRYWQDSLTFNSHMVQVNPQSAAGYINLGINLKEADRLQEAIAAFQKSLALDPNSPQGYLNLGQLYEKISMTQEAEGYYQKALEVDPLYANTYSNLGDLARKNGQLPEALSYYKMALGVQPDAAKDYANLGLTYKDLNQPEEAIAAYQKAIAIEPDFAEVYSNLGLLYEAADQEKAILMYQKALALKPGLGEAANNLGYLYLGLKREKEAIPFFKQAIAAYPDKPLPQNNLGLAYVSLGQLKEAASCFQKAIAIDQTFAPALNNLSKIELQQGNIPAAIDYADQAKALGFDDPKHFEALQGYRK